MATRTRRQGNGTNPTRAAVRGAQRAQLIAEHGVHLYLPPARRFADRRRTASRRACRGPIRED